MIDHFTHKLYSQFEAEGEGGKVGKGVEFGAGEIHFFNIAQTHGRVICCKVCPFRL